MFNSAVIGKEDKLIKNIKNINLAGSNFLLDGVNDLNFDEDEGIDKYIGNRSKTLSCYEWFGEASSEIVGAHTIDGVFRLKDLPGYYMEYFSKRLPHLRDLFLERISSSGLDTDDSGLLEGDCINLGETMEFMLCDVVNGVTPEGMGYLPNSVQGLYGSFVDRFATSSVNINALKSRADFNVVARIINNINKGYNHNVFGIEAIIPMNCVPSKITGNCGVLFAHSKLPDGIWNFKDDNPESDSFEDIYYYPMDMSIYDSKLLTEDMVIIVLLPECFMSFDGVSLNSICDKIDPNFLIDLCSKEGFSKSVIDKVVNNKGNYDFLRLLEEYNSEEEED